MAGKPTRTIILAALAVLLLAPAAAQAGQASVDGSTLLYTDTPGASRNVTWARDADSIEITETLNGASADRKVTGTAGNGCTMDQRNDASATYVCSAAGVTSVRIDLADGDDGGEASSGSAFANPVRYFEDTSFPVTVLGGAGNDEITGGSGADTLDGGPGDDQLWGSRDARNGGDTRDQPALDTITGGDGNDTMRGGKSLDGGPGDDTIYGSIAGSTITGGDGKDTISAGSSADTIDGGAGDDTIDSSDGGDNVAGGDGNDTIEGGDDPDTIDGGPGADTIDARAGADKVAGGDGNDKLDGGTGPDQYVAGDGDDTLVSDDGAKDTLDCGAGDDTVARWDRGKDIASPRASCEHVPEGGLDQRHSFGLSYAKAARTGRLKVRFRCVDCESLKVALIGWQFWFVPNRPGLAMGAGCPQGRTVKLKRTKLDQFDGVLKLTRCERVRLAQAVTAERRGKARFRRFEFHFTTGGHSTGEAFTRGKR